MGRFRTPEIARAALQELLNPDLDMRLSFFVLFGVTQNRETRRLPFEFVKTHFDELAAKAPSSAGIPFASFLPFVGTALCTPEDREQFEQFFKPRIAKFTGAPRNFAQALETIRICEAKKSAQQASAISFFQRY